MTLEVIQGHPNCHLFDGLLVVCTVSEISPHLQRTCLWPC